MAQPIYVRMGDGPEFRVGEIDFSSGDADDVKDALAEFFRKVADAIESDG